jgi:hypothetical protein
MSFFGAFLVVNPMVFVLLLFGLLLIFASASGVGPFIYTLSKI